MYELTVLAYLCASISILSFKEIGTLNVRLIVGSFSFIYNHSLQIFYQFSKYQSITIDQFCSQKHVNKQASECNRGQHKLIMRRRVEQRAKTSRFQIIILSLLNHKSEAYECSW